MTNLQNSRKYQLRTAESVSPKHPDKLCDQISDAILDAHLEQDEKARVAIDVAGGHGKIFITGEVSSNAKNVDVESIAKRIAGECEVIENISAQSPEIAYGVDNGGAGDQGIMIGYAINDTPELLPAEVVLSRRLNQYIFKKFPFDGKTQITIDNSHTFTIKCIVVSFQNAPAEELKDLTKEWLRSEYRSYFTRVNAPKVGGAAILIPIHHWEEWYVEPVRIIANPCGDWNLGGFDADAGLTGRKLAIDNYGPNIPIGGGAFSGKDPSKVDRSAAYMARKIAVEYLEERNAHEVFCRLAYAIGMVEPLEATVIVDGKSESVKGYDLTPNGMVKSLNLRRPIYEATARYGHFGEGFDWDNKTINNQKGSTWKKI